mmetsp:Transcript_9039/g.7958  ORF Transcript_9039/g.7958 Transcript_9039/m.7958 type:complete len:149 (+) Transcript_9039:67-513(+)
MISKNALIVLSLALVCTFANATRNLQSSSGCTSTAADCPSGCMINCQCEDMQKCQEAVGSILTYIFIAIAVLVGGIGGTCLICICCCAKQASNSNSSYAAKTVTHTTQYPQQTPQYEMNSYGGNPQYQTNYQQNQGYPQQQQQSPVGY